MANKRTFLMGIGKDQEHYTIRVRLTRKWEAVNFKVNDELISMDFILLDEYVSKHF